MKKRNRSILFYLAILIFLILSPLVVIFALGYDFDTVNYTLVKTGSLRIKTNVQSQVYINNKFAGDTNFLSNSFSKGHLLPRTYIVRVQNPDYQAWLKFVDIGPSLFSDFPKLVLVPQHIAETTVASSSFSAFSSVSFDRDALIATAVVKDVVHRPGSKYIEKKEVFDLRSGFISLSSEPKTQLKTQVSLADTISKAASLSIDSFDGDVRLHASEHQISIEWLQDAGYQPFAKKGEIHTILQSPVPIIDAQWYKDSAHIIANVGGVLKLIEIDDRGGVNSFDLGTVKGPFFYDPSSSYIYKFNGPILVKLKI